MTKFLWTGESEYCICGHHLTDHGTSQWPISIITSAPQEEQQPPLVKCRGRGGDKLRIIRNRNCHCHCDKFRPYGRIIAGEEEGDDAKMPSLKNKCGR